MIELLCSIIALKTFHAPTKQRKYIDEQDGKRSKYHSIDRSIDRSTYDAEINVFVAGEVDNVTEQLTAESLDVEIGLALQTNDDCQSMHHSSMKSDMRKPCNSTSSTLRRRSGPTDDTTSNNRRTIFFNMRERNRRTSVARLQIDRRRLDRSSVLDR